MSNQIATLSQQISSPQVINSFNKILGEKANQFVASLISAVQSNPKLQNVNFASLIASATTAASLDLPVTPGLGFAYLVPYKDQVQFQIGYKGLIQLCMRSSQFQNINACPVYEEDTDESAIKRLTSLISRHKPTTKIIGYAAYFKLNNGFEKSEYMSIEELEKHAKKYSQTYKSGFGVWKDNFESMAIKTVLKLLLSKYAPMNVEIQKAVIEDQKVDEKYLDNLEVTETTNSKSDLQLFIEEEVETLEALNYIENQLKTEAEKEAFAKKKAELESKTETENEPTKPLM